MHCTTPLTYVWLCTVIGLYTETIRLIYTVEGWIGESLNLLCQVNDPIQLTHLHTCAIKLAQEENALPSQFLYLNLVNFDVNWTEQWYLFNSDRSEPRGGKKVS
jgi:hypothetical protein